MEIKFLKAGKGDSILVSSKGEHMLVDGGDNTTFLLRELDNIHENKESINYLIITHHDSDHIKGILDLFEQLRQGRYGEPQQFIKRVYFNSPRLIKGKIHSTPSKNLSYKQAFQLEELIRHFELLWDELLTDQSESFKVGDCHVKCLSPNKQIVDSYSNEIGAYLSSISAGDWAKNLKELENYISDKKTDKSPPNESSIVLEVERNEFRTLLTADITPARLERILHDSVMHNGNNPLNYSYLKLPHHGSHRNLTANILSKINCNNYIISTDGNNNNLPNKKTILKILKQNNNPKIKKYFYFNHEEVIKCLNIQQKEKEKWGFDLIKNNKDYGYCISAI
jgi:beta-lactamase superfamily II metal-dependent hydrolase